MPISFIPFDGWAPSSSYFGEGWGSTLNLAPIFNNSRPLRQFVADAVDSVAFGPMVGTHTHLWASGVGSGTYLPDAATHFTGSPTRLFSVDPATGIFTDLSRAANYGAAGFPAGWRGASVGNDVWMVNHFDVPQRRVANAGVFTNGITSAFVPIPRFIATIREHLVMANLNQAGRFQDEVVWSDTDNATNFDEPTGTSQSIAGRKRLTSVPGQITGLLGGQHGIAFKRRCIYYLESTGTVQVLRPEIISPHVGTAYGSSIIDTRYGVHFLGPDGFYKMLGLSVPEKVSPPGLDDFLLETLFSTQGATTEQAEDMQMVAFQIPGLALIGWIFRLDWLALGNNQMILHNPVTGAWSYGDSRAIIGPEEEPNFLDTTAIIQRPYGASVYDTIGAISWDSSVARYAPMSDSSVWPPSIGLRFRPANFEGAGKHGQSMLRGVLPVFSKTSLSGASLSPTVVVEAVLDPFNDVYGTPETSVAANRDPISGWYPFQKAGRLFRVTLNCAAEDFADFSGMYIDQEPLA